MSSVNLKGDINAKAVKQKSVEKLVCCSEEIFVTKKVRGMSASEHCFTVQNEKTNFTD